MTIFPVLRVATYRNIEAVSRAPREAGLSIPSIAKKMVMAIMEKIWEHIYDWHLLREKTKSCNGTQRQAVTSMKMLTTIWIPESVLKKIKNQLDPRISVKKD